MPVKPYFRSFPLPYTFAVGNELRDGSACGVAGLMEAEGIKGPKTKKPAEAGLSQIPDLGIMAPAVGIEPTTN